MSNAEKRHILKAIESIAKAQDAMSNRLDRHEKIMDSQAREIADLQQRVLDLRNAAIQADLSAGLPGKDVALKYNLSPGRVSQIKNGRMN